MSYWEVLCERRRPDGIVGGGMNPFIEAETQELAKAEAEKMLVPPYLHAEGWRVKAVIPSRKLIAECEARDEDAPSPTWYPSPSPDTNVEEGTR